MGNSKVTVPWRKLKFCLSLELAIWVNWDSFKFGNMSIIFWYRNKFLEVYINYSLIVNMGSSEEKKKNLKLLQ